MDISSKVQELKTQYQAHSIDLEPWISLPLYDRGPWMEKILRSFYQDKFEPHQRLIFSFAKDEYDELDQPVGNLMKNLQQTLNKVDISNWFVVIVTEDANCNTQSLKRQCLH